MTQLPAPHGPAPGGGPATPGATAVAAAPLGSAAPAGPLKPTMPRAPAPLTPPAPTGFAALLRLAVVSVDADGRVAHWNRGAEELFGHRWEAVFGHPAAGLLTTPAPTATGTGTGTELGPDLDTGPWSGDDGPAGDVFGLLDRLTVPSWTGEFPVTGRDGMRRAAFWWSYRLDEGPGGLLVLAANAASLRSGALRIAIGDRMLPYALVGAAGPEGVRVLPRLGPPGDPDVPVVARLAGRPVDPALAERLRAVLPRIGRGRLERMMRLVRRLGHPALEVEGAAPLPVLPYEAFEPYGSPATAADTAPAPRPEPWLPPTALLPQLLSAADALTDSPDGVPPGVLTGTVTAPGDAPASGAPGSVLVPPGGIGKLPRPAHPSPRPPHVHPRPAHADRLTPHADPWPPRADPRPAGADTVSGLIGADPVHGFPGAEPLPGLDYASVPAPEPAPAPGQLVHQQLALLREAGARVGSTLSLHITAAELCQVAVPRFADFSTVLIVDDAFSGAVPDSMLDAEALSAGDTAAGGDRTARLTVRRLAAANGLADAAWERLLPEGELFTLAAGRAPGLTEPFLLPTVDAALADDLAADLGVPGLGPLLPGRSLLIVPLTARGAVLGRMCFVREPQRQRFSEKDIATAVEFAARGAVHMDNARLHQFEARAATTLQRSMLPGKPPPMPGVRVAHHYRPGDRQAQVGGDWFDAVQLPGGRVALIVGDVMGHGLLSAAVMGQFRTAVQTMAALDLPPAQLLRHLDNLAHKLGTEHLATCVYAVYDPIHRTLTLANAGHIPPVLARPDGRSELLRIPEGAPIGVGGVPFETVEIEVPDGSWLVLCTDGLVEVRGQGIDAGLAALCANVIEPEHTPEDVCRQILSRVHYEDRTDDVALLVARFDGIGRQDVAEWRLKIDDAEVRTAREVTRRQLAEWGLDQLTDLTELLVSELVTNALRVASQEVTLRLMRVGKLLVEVSDDDHNLPQLRRADQDDEHGRGLALVSNLSWRWGTSRKAVGKVVWFELPLPKG